MSDFEIMHRKMRLVWKLQTKIEVKGMDTNCTINIKILREYL